MSTGPGDLHRVAVVGVGAVTAAGVGAAPLFDACLAGRSLAVSHGSEEDPGPVRIATVVGPDFEPKDFLAHSEARRATRGVKIGFGAASLAVGQAGWDLTDEPMRSSVVVGTGLGDMLTEVIGHLEVLDTKGYLRTDPLIVPKFMPSALSSLISMKMGITGSCQTVSLACASGTAAIGDAMRLIRWGEADRVIAGGTESLINPLAIAAFARMGALSDRNDDPAAASRPFDADRNGFVMGEGAGFLALERADLAEARGAEILAFVSGYGATSDAFHLVAPREDGVGAVAAMRLALADAGLRPGDVGHINAHGTSTELNDRAEARAINEVFGLPGPAVYGPKGVVGHLIGGAGGVEAVIAVESVRRGVVPPTANYERPDPEISLDVVAGEPREIGPRAALSNSFAFGGHNATLAISPA